MSVEMRSGAAGKPQRLSAPTWVFKTVFPLGVLVASLGVAALVLVDDASALRVRESSEDCW